ncbi:DNA internalization-related competence protein ComEC/Rec2 [Thiomonas sp.]|uniref:DNA internalization-related competence protein ComEC/Rec2 n=1 Tax=Thiomonas sp. TaxID=2047785 RepID=UPI0026149BB4|nr:DNA internalization-related competence protein ComEC/Rec2 [Thiomonas sp.]
MRLYALAVLLGCLLQTAQPRLWPQPLATTLLLAGLLLSAALLAAQVWRPGWAGRGRVLRLAHMALLAAAGLALGLGLTQWRAQQLLAQRLPAALETQPLQVRGVVTGLPVLDADATRFTFAVLTASARGVPHTLSLSWSAQRGRRLTEPAPRVHPGEIWEFTVRLKQPHGLVNPGGTDSELSLFRAGIGATGSVSRAGPPPRLLGQRHAATDWIAQLRDTLRERMLHALTLPAAGPSQGGERPLGGQRAPASVGAVQPSAAGPSQGGERPLGRQRAPASAGAVQPSAAGPSQGGERPSPAWVPAAGTVVALALGDQAAISPQDWASYRITGVAHLMSISGLHISLLAWLALHVTGWLWRQTARLPRPWTLRLPAPTVATWAALLTAAAYAVISGWGVPAQRTLLMLAVVLLLRLRGLRADWADVMALALLAVLLWDPWAVRQAGFWLSFVAVGFLFLSGGAQRGRRSAGAPQGMLQRLRHALADAAQAQWVATLALLPLTLLFFQQIAVLSPLANALAIPVVTLSVTPLAIGGLLLPSPLDGWAWRLAAWLQHALDGVLQHMAAWPAAQWHAAAADAVSLALAAAGVVALTLPWTWRLRAPGLLLLLPLTSNPGTAPPPGRMELWFADVGQGMAVVVRTAHHTLVYDTGPQQAPGVDAGSRVVLPLLHSLGVRRLDRVVVSHDDSDHSGGAAAIARVHPEAELLTAVSAARVPRLGYVHVSRCQAGQHWQWDGVEFRIINPLPGDVPRNDNAGSCVLHVAARGGSALLTGDIDQAQERALHAAGALPYADVLLVPHHGSKTSSSDTLLDSVMPRLAVVQAGYRNVHRHPHPLVIERYAARGIAVWRTDLQGALRWRDDTPDSMLSWRAAQPHYWSWGATAPAALTPADG